MKTKRMLLTAVLGLSFLGAFGRFSSAAGLKYSVETVPEYDAVFERTEGWTGGDGVYSVDLGKDITLWLFSDTWVGPVVDERHKGAKLVNNTVAIQRGPTPSKDNVKFYWGKTENGKPDALIKPADGVGWFWIFDGVMVDGELYLFLMQMVKAEGSDAFGFRQIGTWLGRVANPLDEPETWRIKQYKIPHGRYSKQGNTFFGSAVMKDKGSVYIYGTMENWSKGFGGRSLTVARARPEEAISDFGAWRFYGSEGWKADMKKSALLFSGSATECSVSYQPGIKKYVAIYTENGMSKNILMRTATMPTGPWSKPEKIFECPEVDWHEKYFCYAAKGHPEISAEDELIVTYICNSMDFQQMVKDARIYRPRFLRIKFDVPEESERIERQDCLKTLYFQLKAIDEQTGRGVPLIELTTTNHLSFVTDSHGIAAIYEPGLMNTKVFFHVSGHGYEYPKDGFGYRGKKGIELTPGGSATLKVKRLNIAERLYRMTGQGIYRDSVITGNPVPLSNPVINGLVTGQDSVQTCLYGGKLYWFWGDTSRPFYPLGHFSMAGAVSDLPDQGGLDPSLGVDLQYFTDEEGFSRKMAPMAQRGLIWLDGVFAVSDSAGKRHMLAKFARMENLGTAHERGLMAFNDDSQQFEPIVRSAGPQFLLHENSGHPFAVKSGSNRYYYFATPFPLSVRMRVRAAWEDARDPNKYEVFTSLSPSGQNNQDAPKRPFRWVFPEDLLGNGRWTRSQLIGALEKEKRGGCLLYDIETAAPVKPHGGTVYWNHYRRKWIMITVQDGGGPSYLGEVWYAESDTPAGPWGYARKVVTHDSYSFYNPKQHPYFDQDGGRLIYFEGTYSHTFSGKPGNQTPRYDYNQIMYRLDLADKRLCLPAPVYEIDSREVEIQYLLGSQVRDQGKTARVRRIAFYAIGPDRAFDGLIPLYAAKGPAIVAKAPAESAKPFFFALPPAETAKARRNIVAPLFEYTNKKTGAKRYSTDDLKDRTWKKAKTPLCCVWKTPGNAILADWQAQSWAD